MKNRNPNPVEEIEKCPNCESKNINKDQYHAEIVCGDCGLVMEDDLIDYSPEWREFTQEDHEKKARTGRPTTPLLHDKGLTTTIDWKNRDYSGRKIPSKTRAQLYRLRKWQRRLRTSRYRERNLIQALRELDRLASALSVPRNIRETAAKLYRKAVTENLIRGRSIEGMVAATLYAACRQCDLPRTLDEISKKTEISKKEIGRNYRFISRKLKLKLKPTSPLDYLKRFGNMLNLNGETKQKARKILKKAKEKELISGKGPISLAAAAIYISSVLTGEKKTQKEIAEIANVTEVTIRNRYKELANQLGIDIQVQ
ncbi:MAG: transcription initiation factor IIB [Candidatus Thermoplasmatota archaeon]